MGFSVEVKLHDIGQGNMYMSFEWQPTQPTDEQIDGFGEEYDAILSPIFAVMYARQHSLQPYQ